MSEGDSSQYSIDSLSSSKLEGMRQESQENSNILYAKEVSTRIKTQMNINEQVHQRRVEEYELLQESYVNGFLPDYYNVHQLLRQLSIGNISSDLFNFDTMHAYGSPQEILEYFRAFQFYDYQSLPELPILKFNAVPKFGNVYISNDVGQNTSLNFTRNLTTEKPLSVSSMLQFPLPILVDKKPISLKEFLPFLQLEKGQAVDVAEFYKETRELNAQKYGRGMYVDPLVQRMIVVVPVSKKYETEALLNIALTGKEDSSFTAYNPYLRMNGETNDASTLLEQESWRTNTLALNINGYQGLIKIAQAQSGNTEINSAATGYLSHSFTLVLYPLSKEKKIEKSTGIMDSIINPGYINYPGSDQLVYRQEIGGATISSGGNTSFHSYKPKESIIGERYRARYDQRPIIISGRIYITNSI